MPIRVSQLQDGDVSAQQLHTEGPDAEGSSPSLEFLSRYAGFTPLGTLHIWPKTLPRNTEARGFRNISGSHRAFSCWISPLLVGHSHGAGSTAKGGFNPDSAGVGGANGVIASLPLVHPGPAWSRSTSSRR